MSARRGMALVSAVVVVLATVALWGGCGGATESPVTMGDQTAPRVSGQGLATEPVAALSQASAEEVDFHGWKAFRLANGLISVLAVPAAGGRILSYQLGQHEYLFTQDNLLGKALETQDDPGGDRVQVLSSDGAESPLSGKWTGSITTAAGLLAEVKLVSPSDRAAGVQVTRTLRLYAGSTRLQVTDTLKNLGEAAGTWSLGSVAELTGRQPEQLRAYAPANVAPGHPQGFWGSEGLGATVPGASRRVEVTYGAKPGAISVWAAEGWLALADGAADAAWVRRFPARGDQKYPAGALAEIAVAEGRMLLSSRAPLQEIGAGQSVSFAQDWYATTTPAPIVDVTDMAALTQAPTLKTEGGKPRLTGKLGVFATGSLALTPVDASGQPVGTPVILPANPGRAVAIDQEVAVGAASIVRLSLENDRGTELGRIAELPTQ